jgi:fatty-acyl-CoA synthase
MGPANGIPYNAFLSQASGTARTQPKGDEIYMLYTGGTTGMPKGVMYPLDSFTEFFMRGIAPMIGLAPFEEADQFGPTARQMVDTNSAVVAMSGPPLMHGTGCWLGLMFPHMLGGTSVLLENRGFKPEEVWSAVERDRISQIIIVGDAFAKPLLRALETEPDRWDTSSLKLMISSGAMFTTEVKRGLIDQAPELAIVDILGSTEGGMGQSIMTKDTPDSETAKFTLLPVATVLLPDGSREVAPGSGEVGMVAQSGMVPLGYYKDSEKSAKTFKEIDGKRYAFIGDMATVEADGTINLLGRGSNCINTGGEKVFPEEVEEALKLYPAVEDALVFGLDDERFGSRVVGVVSLENKCTAEVEEILDATRKVLASYKLPKELLIVPTVPRAPNGKADYKSAKALLIRP